MKEERDGEKDRKEGEGERESVFFFQRGCSAALSQQGKRLGKGHSQTERKEGRKGGVNE